VEPVVDEVLELKVNGYYATGYEDDSAIPINGKFPSTVLRGTINCPETDTAAV
jgi:hypothetical protein